MSINKDEEKETPADHHPLALEETEEEGNDDSEHVPQKEEEEAAVSTAAPITTPPPTILASTSPPLPPTTKPTVQQTNSGTATSSTSSVAFFQDADGQPLFPRLYQMRRGGGDKEDDAAASSSTAAAQKTLQAWQRASKQALSTAQSASQQAFSTAQSNWQKGMQKVAQSSASLFDHDKGNHHDEDDNKENNSNDDKQVGTPFGPGTLKEFRASTETYIIQLASGGMLYTQQAPKEKETSKITKKTKKTKKRTKTVLELNETFMEWEKARHAEVEQEGKRLGIPCTEETKQKCFACLKQDAAKPPVAKSPPPQQQQPSAALLTNAAGKPLFPRLHKWRQSGQAFVKENTQQLKSAVTTSRDTTASCLLCATVCCAAHASPAFRKENVTLCLDCVHQVEHNDYAKARLPADVARETQRLCDLYGRALLLLQYTAQYMIATAEQLEAQTKQHNEIAGVGGSSVGLASGILGVAAACTIMTPLGPPLLLGSLVMGGSATAVQAGGEAYKYYSEPNQLANRVLTLQGIVDMILAKFQAMRETTLIPYLDRAVSRLEVIEEIPNMAAESKRNETKEVATRATATCLGSTAATSAAASLARQEGAMAGRFVSRATTAAARTARFARFAGGALSAATLVLEARELRRTLDQMEKGNPCEKAEHLRQVHAGVYQLPSQAKVARICRTYVKVRSRELFQEAMTTPTTAGATTTSSFPIPMSGAPQSTEELPAPLQTIPTAMPSQQDMAQAVLAEGPRQQQEEEWQLVEEVVASLEDADRSSIDDGSESVVSDISFCNVDDHDTSSTPKQPTNKTSLLRRLVRFKEREAHKVTDAELALVA